MQVEVDGRRHQCGVERVGLFKWEWWVVLDPAWTMRDVAWTRRGAHKNVIKWITWYISKKEIGKLP